jgi:hypothetical protein
MVLFMYIGHDFVDFFYIIVFNYYNDVFFGPRSSMYEFFCLLLLHPLSGKRQLMRTQHIKFPDGYYIYINYY